MAIRINVTAVREAAPLEVRVVMSEVIRLACPPTEECQPVGDRLEIHEHNGWVWFTTSVWGVSAGDLNRGLCRLARPALQFTTSDGDRWYLTVHGGPQGQVHFTHEFHLLAQDPDPAGDAERQQEAAHVEEPEPTDPQLAFLEEEPLPGATGPRTVVDLFAGELGSPIPEEVRATLTGLPYSQVVARYRRLLAEQVLTALAAAGIPHDPQAVRPVLLWENVSDNESGSDLGNLPRLLSALGLGGSWDDWVGQAETPPPEITDTDKSGEPEIPDEPPPDYVTPVLTLAEPHQPVPVQGGPVAIPLREMALVRFFVEALSLNDTAGVVLRVTVPEPHRAELSRLAEPTGDREGAVLFSEDGFQFRLMNHLWFRKQDLIRHLGKRLARRLYHLPDGATLEALFARTELPECVQRYRGTVQDETWWIDATHPSLNHRDLVEGLDVARLGEVTKLRLRDEGEALALVAQAERDPELWELKVERKGRTVRCQDDFGGHLVKLLFRLRHGAAWKDAAFRAEAEKQYREAVTRHSAMRRAGIEAARRRAAPHVEEPLLQTRNGLYWQSDFTQLTELEQETREKLDTALADLGFRRIGDLVAKKQRDIVLRWFISGDGRSYAVLMAKRTMYLGYEFFSRFADGTTLTTTTNGSVDSHPEAGIFYKVCWGADIPTLHAKHAWGIDRFRTHRQTEPMPLDPTLLGAAQELDAAFTCRASAK